MSSTILSPTIITREALRLLHANLNFIGNVNRQYDDKFANEGASPSGKIGPTLTIRMPNAYTVRTGATINVQETTEESQTLTVSTQKGVDSIFTVKDLTLSIDEFSDRYLKPQMAVLASAIEADALSMADDVYNFFDHDASALVFDDLLGGQELLQNNLCPDDGDRCLIMPPRHNRRFTNSTIAQLNPQAQISEQWRNGAVARRTGGFDKIYENTLISRHLTGTAVGGDTTWNVSAADQVGSEITLDTGSGTLLKGDVVTFAGCNAVHPESKADLGYLKQFVVTENFTTGTLKVSPTLVLTGAKQNISAAPTNGGAVSKLGSGTSASQYYVYSLGFHKDAFTFVTADLIDVSKFGSWGARQVMDGISMRIARQYDIVNDKIPCRLDVLYGYKTLRAQLAVRIHADG